MTEVEPVRRLGGYDGVDLWTLRAWSLGSVHEQVFASLHERLHHELQSSTLWGLITRFADDFMHREKYRRSARLLFWTGVMRSQVVHETFATTLAAGTDPDFVAALRGNAAHLLHHRRGMALLGSTAETWDLDRYVVDAALRACMLAPGLVALAGRMPAVRVADLDVREQRPDERLARLQEIDLRPMRELVDAAPATIAELRDLHDAVAGRLAAQGFPTARSAETRAAIEELVDRARTLLGLEITIDEERSDPMADDVDGFQRERIELHAEALPAVALTLRQAAANPADFVRDHPQLGNHVLIVWVRPDVLARQVAGFVADGADHILALQAAGTDESGEAVVRIAVTAETSDPSDLAAAFANVATLILTTLSSLVDAPADASFAGPDDLFVLVDLPVAEALERAFERGPPVRWARFEVGGERDLKGIVWEATGLPGVIHLYIASEAGQLALVRWLAAQPEALATHAHELMRSRQMQIDAVVQHVFAAWHVIERRDRAGG